ncbi:hypothetical protein L3i22_024100 [Actinoplanes sp. L3-i22]|nr:hypothetical protein L3i22_024100 [Actinoplanes sp. L3-i22]
MTELHLGTANMNLKVVRGTRGKSSLMGEGLPTPWHAVWHNATDPDARASALCDKTVKDICERWPGDSEKAKNLCDPCRTKEAEFRARTP